MVPELDTVVALHDEATRQSSPRVIGASAVGPCDQGQAMGFGRPRA